MDDKLLITPKTKVLQLIEAYPQLEEVLIRHVPAFKKLKNPVLRKTVAKIATLQQAAAIGNVKIEDLVNLLRKEAGQDFFSGNGEGSYNMQKPGWFDEKLISKTVDAKPVLEKGEEPVGEVISDLSGLKPGSIYKLIAPFLPAPLIDKATSLGMEHWVKKESEESFTVYFLKK